MGVRLAIKGLIIATTRVAVGFAGCPYPSPILSAGVYTATAPARWTTKCPSINFFVSRFRSSAELPIDLFDLLAPQRCSLLVRFVQHLAHS
jgi:hypothetical protein